MTIYVATDKDGKIFDWAAGSIAHLAILLNDVLDRKECSHDDCIRPITVTATDGIIGKHWQGVDCSLAEHDAKLLEAKADELSACISDDYASEPDSVRRDEAMKDIDWLRYEATTLRREHGLEGKGE